jgi:RNAse (barnase) inhibitor barstar
MKKIRLSTDKINDWPSFHQVFAETMDFPSEYGRNLDAWVECMQQAATPDELLVVELPDVEHFKARCPEQFVALLNRTVEVNAQYASAGREAAVALVFA